MSNLSTIRRITLAGLLALAAPAAARAQDNPLSDNNRLQYGQLKLWLVGSAQKMPEENFGFQPTAAVRSYGSILGHVADVQYRFCSIVLNEKNPAPNIEKTVTSKAGLIAALETAFAYCDRAYNAMTDANGVEMIKLGPGMPKLGVLSINNLHTTLHYGNLVTYMRLKNVVPPSSDTEFNVPLPKKPS